MKYEHFDLNKHGKDTNIFILDCDGSECGGPLRFICFDRSLVVCRGIREYDAFHPLHLFVRVEDKQPVESRYVLHHVNHSNHHSGNGVCIRIGEVEEGEMLTEISKAIVDKLGGEISFER